MPDPVTAVVGGGAVVGGALGGREARKGAEAGADAQIAAQEASIAEQRAARESFEERLAPFEEFGLEARAPALAALGLGPSREQLLAEQQKVQDILEGRGHIIGRTRLENRLGRIQSQLDALPGELTQVDLAALPAAGQAFDPSAVQDNPIFDFLLEEGFRGIEERGAGGGRNVDRDLVQYAQGTAASLVPQLQQQQFGQQQQVRGQALAEQAGLRADALSEQQQRIGNLLGALGIGQSAAAGVGSAGLQSAGQIGTALGNIGSAQAQAAQQVAASRQQDISNLLGVGGFLAGQTFAQPSGDFAGAVRPAGQQGPFTGAGLF